MTWVAVAFLLLGVLCLNRAGLATATFEDGSFLLAIGKFVLGVLLCFAALVTAALKLLFF